MRRFQTALLFFFSVMPAFGASFDCKRASTTEEIAICLDRDLSRLDGLMGTLYSELRTFGPLQDQIADGQKDWLRKRRTDCGFATQKAATVQQVDCLTMRTRSRIAELASFVAGHAASGGTQKPYGETGQNASVAPIPAQPNPRVGISSASPDARADQGVASQPPMTAKAEATAAGNEFSACLKTGATEVAPNVGLADLASAARRVVADCSHLVPPYHAALVKSEGKLKADFIISVMMENIGWQTQDNIMAAQQRQIGR